jgi:hypothetical protein
MATRKQVHMVQQEEGPIDALAFAFVSLLTRLRSFQVHSSQAQVAWQVNRS